MSGGHTPALGRWLSIVNWLPPPSCCQASMAVVDSPWVDMYAPLRAQARAQEREEAAAENDQPITSESEACEDEEEEETCIVVPTEDTPITTCAKARCKPKRPYACTKCGETFASGDKLRVHDRRKHTGEKPYACRMPGCGWAFVNSWDRTVHERTHTGEKRYACEHCGQKFAAKQQMKVHVMRMHTFEKPWKCGECSKAFTTKGQLTEHVRWHTGEKPFECAHPGCGKRFTTKGELTVHVRDHLAVKPFPCRHPGCERQFTVRFVRKTHEREKHGLVVVA